MASTPGFYEWLLQTQPQRLITDDGATLRADQVEGNRNFAELRNEYITTAQEQFDVNNPTITHNGEQWQALFDTGEGGLRTPTRYADLQSDPNFARFQSIAGDQLIERNGIAYVPTRVATDPRMTGEAGRGFIHNFLNGPGAVLLPLAIATGGTLAAAAGTGGSSAITASELANYWNPATAGIGGTPLTVGGTVGGTVGADALTAELADYWNPASYVTELSGTGTPGVGDAGAFDQAGSAGSGIPGSGPSSQASYASIYGPAGTGTGGSSILSQLSKILTGSDGSGSTGSAGSDGILDALSKLFPNANLSSILTGLAQSGLGYLGAKAQTDALKEMQQKWLDLGAPSRARLEGSYAPGFDIFEADPAAKGAATTAADIAARSYSAKSGNPFDQPTSQGGIYRDVLSQVALPQLNTYRNQNITAGQLGLSTAGTAGLEGTKLAGSGLDAIAAGLSTALNPPTDWNKLYADMLKNNYKLTVG